MTDRSSLLLLPQLIRHALEIFAAALFVLGWDGGGSFAGDSVLTGGAGGKRVVAGIGRAAAVGGNAAGVFAAAAGKGGGRAAGRQVAIDADVAHRAPPRRISPAGARAGALAG